MIFYDEEDAERAEKLLPGYFAFRYALVNQMGLSGLEDLVRDVETWEVCNQDGLFISQVLRGDFVAHNEAYNVNVVELMLNEGANIDAFDPRMGSYYFDQTVLETGFSCLKELDHINGLMVTYGADIYRKNYSRESLYFLIDNTTVKPIDKFDFLQQEADGLSINMKNIDGKTALDVLIEKKVRRDIIELYEDNGAERAEDL